MKQNKVREVQEYLHKEGIDESEAAIINAAIDIARRISGMDDWVFAREFGKETKNEKGGLKDEIRRSK